MKKLGMTLFAALTVIIFSGCTALSTSSAYVSTDQLRSITKGTEQADVVAKLGLPENTQIGDGQNVLQYKITDALDGSHQIDVYFDGSGKFTRYEERFY